MLFPKPKRHQDRELLDKAHTGRCIICGRHGCDPEHTKTKGSGGDDLPHNISYICRRHHQEKGNKGISHMAEKYVSYRNWLLSNGWYFCQVREKWVNDLNNKKTQDF